MSESLAKTSSVSAWALRSAHPPLRLARSVRKPRVMLIADGCNPTMTSVPLEGWSHSKAISEITDALVVTHTRNRKDLTAAGWTEGREFACIDTEKPAKLMWNLATLLRGGMGTGWTTLAALTVPLYYLFEHYLWQQYGARLIAGEFDVVHRLIPLSPTTPSLLATQCRRIGVPFVVGPLNGGVPWPKGFDQARRKEREWLSYVRSAYKLLPGYRSMRSNSAAILIGSRDTFNQMPRQYHDRCVYVPENAIDPQRFALQPARTAPTRPIRAIFIGRLVPYKGADILIEAAAPLLKSGAMTVEIVGDGPQMPELRELVQRLGVTEQVKLTGWVDHRKVQESLARADVFAFPSIREFGGAVVLEAMAVGVVPIVVDYGGPAELITEKTGFAIELGTRQEITARFRTVLSELASDPDKIVAKSAAATRRAREQFTWQYKARQVMDVYQWVLGNATKPQFPMPLPD